MYARAFSHSIQFNWPEPVLLYIEVFFLALFVTSHVRLACELDDIFLSSKRSFFKASSLGEVGGGGEEDGGTETKDSGDTGLPRGESCPIGLLSRDMLGGLNGFMLSVDGTYGTEDCTGANGTALGGDEGLETFPWGVVLVGNTTGSSTLGL